MLTLEEQLVSKGIWQPKSPKLGPYSHHNMIVIGYSVNSTSQIFHRVGMANTTGHFTRSADSYMLPVYLGAG